MLSWLDRRASNPLERCLARKRHQHHTIAILQGGARIQTSLYLHLSLTYLDLTQYCNISRAPDVGSRHKVNLKPNWEFPSSPCNNWLCACHARVGEDHAEIRQLAGMHSQLPCVHPSSYSRTCPLMLFPDGGNEERPAGWLLHSGNPALLR